MQTPTPSQVGISVGTDAYYALVVADWLPNIEAEIGLALVLAGLVLIYWPKREDPKNVERPP